MNHKRSARTRARRVILVATVGLMVGAAAIAGTLIAQAAPAMVVGDEPSADAQQATAGGDGSLPDGVSVFDDSYAGVANLDPDLLAALRAAATEAELDGVEFFVNSGWRSREYQQQLLEEAVATYGSLEEAARWVATPERSAHVSGDAVDVGDLDAMVWLSNRGFEYGLCQTYDNERWHYELRPEAVSSGCPPLYDDPTQDPSMQE